jgi:hypothetical protein
MEAGRNGRAATTLPSLSAGSLASVFFRWTHRSYANRDQNRSEILGPAAAGPFSLAEMRDLLRGAVSGLRVVAKTTRCARMARPGRGSAGAQGTLRCDI